jgi:hypothetical protein
LCCNLLGICGGDFVASLSHHPGNPQVAVARWLSLFPPLLPSLKRQLAEEATEVDAAGKAFTLLSNTMGLCGIGMACNW